MVFDSILGLCCADACIKHISRSLHAAWWKSHYTCTMFLRSQRAYAQTARQLKRFDSIKRSPVFNLFSETLSGVTSIRAYGCQERFIRQNDHHLDESQRIWYMVFTANRLVQTYICLPSSKKCFHFEQTLLQMTSVRDCMRIFTLTETYITVYNTQLHDCISVVFCVQI